MINLKIKAKFNSAKASLKNKFQKLKTYEKDFRVMSVRLQRMELKQIKCSNRLNQLNGWKQIASWRL